MYFLKLDVWNDRRVAKATGAQMVLTLADMDGNETFDASALGTAEEVRASGPRTNLCKGPKTVGDRCTASWVKVPLGVPNKNACPIPGLQSCNPLPALG